MLHEDAEPSSAPPMTHGSSAPLEPLDGLDELPTGEHVARYEAVHERLRARLDDAVDDDEAGE